MWYRIATILACASIVVTAVYILRAAGKTLMGPIEDEHYKALPDATWNEKFAAGLLIVGIVAIGIAPFWLNHLVNDGTQVIMNKLSVIVK